MIWKGHSVPSSDNQASEVPAPTVTASMVLRWEVDPFSTGLTFDGWRDLERVRVLRQGYPLLPVWRPKTWLLVRAGESTG